MPNKRIPTGNPNGRPPIFKTEEDMKKAIDKYFKNCESRDVPYTMAGLAVALDIDRQTLYNYEKKDKFFGIVKKARDKIEQAWEEHAFMKGNAGCIFVMKNYGYTDKQEVAVEHSNFDEVLGKFVGKL